MTRCVDLRRGVRTQAEIAQRRLDLLRDIDQALDESICDVGGIDRLIALRIRIRAEVGS